MKKIILIFTILMFIIFTGFFILKIRKETEKSTILEIKKDRLEEVVLDKKRKLEEIKSKNNNIKAEIAEIRRKEQEKKKRLVKLRKEKLERARRNILPYKYGHRIFNDKKYVPIKIPEKYQKYFSIAEVTKGDNYWTILERVFGKSKWGEFSSSEKNAFVNYGEKISRVGRYNLKNGMKLVLPNSKEGLSFSPLKSKLSEEFLKEVAGKRDEKIGQYWIDFGSAYGNKIFQSRAGKKSSHILIIDRKNQYFGMYKNGILQNWGPISSGKVGHVTPAGFYISLWYKDMWNAECCKLWSRRIFYSRGDIAWVPSVSWLSKGFEKWF